MKKIFGVSVIASYALFGAAYKIPEQSLNSMALSAAYVAHTTGADTAYFNPANMAFMGDKNYVEGGITLAHLSSTDYTLVAPYSGSSKVENILIPNLHFVAKPIGDFRWGVSLTAPAGLTKRWDTTYQKAYAQEFTLKNVELNPVASYKINDKFSVGGGLRAVYSEGIVKSTGPVSRDMHGDTIEFGYNLAATYKPTNDINLAATYRSNIDLKEEGNAKLYSGTTKVYDGGASVTVPIPAAFNLAASKTFNDNLTVELNYERTMWSKYKNLDFNYATPIPAPLVPVFDTPVPKDWKDSNTYRIGLTYKADDKLTLMGGFAIDETPVPAKTIGFELPDSDAKIFSLGFRYKASENLSYGAALLYDFKDSRTLSRGVADNAVLKNGGTFDNSGAVLTTVGLAYEF